MCEKENYGIKAPNNKFATITRNKILGEGNDDVLKKIRL